MSGGTVPPEYCECAAAGRCQPCRDRDAKKAALTKAVDSAMKNTLASSGFAETTRKMANEVAAVALKVRMESHELWAKGPAASQALADVVEDLAEAVEKLARCVARRFPGNPDGTP